ncbi:MAG: 5-methyltetrahydropteroyltriglutamate--homocysteine methyltransferase [Xanthobacteraceae bacterium]
MASQIVASKRLPPKILPTTVVGSYPQPDWLVNRALLAKGVPRTRLKEIWRVAEPFLEQAQDDATVLAIRDMERAGIDIITDGEIRRESYSNRFATALEGMDLDKPGHVQSSSGRPTPVPRIVGKLRRQRPVELRDMQFLRGHTQKPAKMTLPGPFTISQQAKNEYYRDEEEMVMDLAAAVNEEAQDLQKAGADTIQLDEPWVRNNPAGAQRYAIKGINRALQGITVPTVVHICFGYAAVVPGSAKPQGYPFLPELADSIAQQISIEAAQPKLDLGVLADLKGKTVMLGVLDLGDARIESAEEVAARIRAGLKYLAPEKLIPAPDCGMKYLARDVALAKLAALVAGTALVRRELQ